MTKRMLRAGCALGVLIGMTTMAHAQDANTSGVDAQSGQDNGQIGEIIVTATRRAESLQRVPVAATVLGGETWQKTPNFSLENIALAVPSVTFESTSSTRNNTVRIRGVGSSTSSSGVEPSTSTVLDGVVLIRSGQAAAANLIDINRIEVLRGPQGTLFGKNASVGVVNITTLDPSEDFSGRIDALATDDDEYQVRGTISSPLTDTLSFRVSGFYRNYGGNLVNVFDGKKQNAVETGGARGKLLWKPTDRLTIRLIGDYTKSDSNCCARPIRNLNTTNPKAAAEAPFLLPVIPGKKNKFTNTDLELKDNYHGDTFSAEINYELGDYTLTSITAHQDFKIRQQIDDDLTGVGPVPGGEAFKQNNFSVEDVNGDTQEVRIASPTGGVVDYVGGLFFLDATVDQNLITTRRKLTVPNNQRSTFQSRVRFRNYAAFGQVNVHPTDKLTLLLGARYTIDKATMTYARQDDPVAPFRDGNTSYEIVAKKKDLSIKAGAQYQVTPDIFTYATFAEGYKGPGFNVATNSSAALSTLRPEVSNNYEAGVKTRLLGNTLALNFAFFQSDFSDFVVSAVEPSTNTVQLVNAAKLRSRGVEMDFNWRLTRNFTISGGAAYVKATVNITNTPCYDYQTAAQGCFTLSPGTTVQNIRKGDLPLSPDLKFNIAAFYRIELPSLPFDISLNGGIVYTDKQQFSLNQDPTRIQGDYALLDAGITFEHRRTGITVEAYGRNLTNQFYATGMGTPTELTGSTFHYIPREASRYFGLRINVPY